MRIRSTPALALTMATLSITGLTAAPIVTVSQQNQAFAVASLRISQGEAVHFTNDDRFLHQIYVKAPSITFESEEQEPGKTVDIQFPKTGLFEVRCHIHPKMLLRVEVY